MGDSDELQTNLDNYKLQLQQVISYNSYVFLLIFVCFEYRRKLVNFSSI